MAARRADVLARTCPTWSPKKMAKILGFAYCNWFKPRPAYRFSAEDSIYMAESARGKGLGAKLLAALSQAAEAPACAS
jgi:L-amino acid N-acyltransferase YncA